MNRRSFVKSLGAIASSAAVGWDVSGEGGEMDTHCELSKVSLPSHTHNNHDLGELPTPYTHE